MNHKVKERFDLERLCILPGQGEQSALEARYMVRFGDAGMSLLEATVEPQQLLPPHTHMHTHQAVYVISGELKFNLGGKDGYTFDAPKGSYVIKPKRIVHSFWNVGTETVKYIELSNDDLFEGFIDSFSDKNKFSAIDSSHTDFGMFTDLEQTIQLMMEYNLTSLAQFGIDFRDTEKVKNLLASAPVKVISAFKKNFEPIMNKLGI